MKKNSESRQSKRSIISITSLLIATLAACLCLYNFSLIKREKIACVNTAKVLKAYKGIEEMSKAFEERNKQFKQRLDTLSIEFQNSLKDYEKNRSKLNPKEIQNEENKLRQMQNDYTQFNGSNQDGLKQEELKIIQKALDNINNKIKHYAKNKGYAVVLAESPNNAVIYVNEYIDITEEIIHIVND